MLLINFLRNHSINFQFINNINKRIETKRISFLVIQFNFPTRWIYCDAALNFRTAVDRKLVGFLFLCCAPPALFHDYSFHCDEFYRKILHRCFLCPSLFELHAIGITFLLWAKRKFKMNSDKKRLVLIFAIRSYRFIECWRAASGSTLRLIGIFPLFKLYLSLSHKLVLLLIQY